MCGVGRRYLSVRRKILQQRINMKHTPQHNCSLSTPLLQTAEYATWSRNCISVCSPEWADNPQAGPPYATRTDGCCRLH
jgi:hypothetical protein